ncbi:hypothetical protein U1Q18_050543 [Sarracenia purpurea var. burkii]
MDLGVEDCRILSPEEFLVRKYHAIRDENVVLNASFSLAPKITWEAGLEEKFGGPINFEKDSPYKGRFGQYAPSPYLPPDPIPRGQRSEERKRKAKEVRSGQISPKKNLPTAVVEKLPRSEGEFDEGMLSRSVLCKLVGI